MSTYRRVGGTSNIDESLFGTSEREKILSGGKSKLSSSSDKRRNKSAGKSLTLPPATAIVLTSSELDSIKRNTIMKTEQEMQAERDIMLKAKAEKEKIQLERKQRMIELGERAKLLAKKSDLEIRKEALETSIRNAASDLRDKDSDVVKNLKTLAARAAAFTIRDAQLLDHEQRKKAEEEYDRRMDTIMEIDRLRDIERRESEEAFKRKKRIDDRKVITEQIQERERMRLIAAEARDQENQAMKNLMKKYQDEDEVKAERRRVDMAQSRAETMAMNEQAIARKRQAREAEKKEMEDILIYQAMKDAELAKREEEEEAVEKAKKDRQALLLGQQEKALNRAGELDELRARRAAEEHERRARKKEYDEYTKKKREMKDLVESRVRQAQDKKEREASTKIFQEEEYRQALLHMAKAAEREQREANEKKTLIDTHRVLLNKQIHDDDLRKKMVRQDNTNEGTKFRQDLIRDEAKFQVVRDRMIKDLISQGVNEKYLSEMKSVDIGKILKR